MHVERLPLKEENGLNYKHGGRYTELLTAFGVDRFLC